MNISVIWRALASRINDHQPGIQTDSEHNWARSLSLGAMAILIVSVSLLFTAGTGATSRSETPEASTQPQISAAFNSERVPESHNTAQAAGPDPNTQRALSVGKTGLVIEGLSNERFKNLSPLMGRAEVRLIEIYQLLAQQEHREALSRVEQLLKDHPNYQLAHLVRGDLLSAHAGQKNILDEKFQHLPPGALEQLASLKEEAHRRLRGLTERPPEGRIPKQFLSLSSRSRHAIAIDASRSRLYLFENLAASGETSLPVQGTQLRLLADFYISVGQLGIEKQQEGDRKTPVGIYYITSRLDTSKLPDLYGTGALPINYPNALDQQRGKTGHGIWLHGTPSNQFVRAPEASDGCIVLANPDLERLMSKVQPRTTPVVIAAELEWVQPQTLQNEREDFEGVLRNWLEAKNRGQLYRLKWFYAERFSHKGNDLSQWWPQLEREIQTSENRQLTIQTLSMLHWQDSEETMVVSFSEGAEGQRRTVDKRQYWVREKGRWKIFSEGSDG
jgi:L,D-transpeptidase YnhG